jgi:hypothetical protein
VIIRIVTPCRNVVGYQCFGGLCRLHLQGEDDIPPHHYTTFQSRRLWLESSSPWKSEIWHTDMIFFFTSNELSITILLQVTEYWLDDRMIGVRIPGWGLGIFLFTTASRPALGSTHSPIQWVPVALSLEVKRPSSKNAWSLLPLHQYAFMAWYSVKRAQGQLYFYLSSFLHSASKFLNQTVRPTGGFCIMAFCLLLLGKADFGQEMQIVVGESILLARCSVWLIKVLEIKNNLEVFLFWITRGYSSQCDDVTEEFHNNRVLKRAEGERTRTYYPDSKNSHQIMMRWAGYAARMGEMSNVCNILVREPEGKRILKT